MKINLKSQKILLVVSVFFYFCPFNIFGFTIGAAQFAISENTYQNKGNFENAILHSMGSLEGADFVIFPEYTSAFTPLFFGAEPNMENLIETHDEVKVYIYNFWGDIAREFDTWILAGTYLEVIDQRIYNTALLFNPQGEMVYKQQKCYLGFLEKEFGLSSGSVELVNPFYIDEIPFALTICRDTYNSIWDDHFPEECFWIDIKANELEYTPEYYDGALPKRLLNSPIDKGLTLSLVGSILGYNFEGPTIVHLDDTAYITGWTIQEENHMLIPLNP